MPKVKKLACHFCLYAVLLGALIWALGFVLFVLYALSFKFAADTHTKGIVVLTGGVDRIDTAAGLLKETDADYMLISGVNRSVKAEKILSKIEPDLIERVTLGYLAENTTENAIETAAWIRGKNLKSILLVTSFYHVPRSKYEIFKQMPEVDVSVHPVFPKSFDNSVDWIYTRYAWLLMVEYHKFIAVYLKHYFLGRLL